MKNKFLILLGAFAIALASCTQDYGSDIGAISASVEEIGKNITAIQNKIDNGYVITDVKSVENGVVVVLSNGESFVINNGKDGIDGLAGKDGTVWTIGDNGNWYCDGVDSGKSSVGLTGEKGDKGDQGIQGETGLQGDKGDKGDSGKDGKDGKYYRPETDETSVNYGKWICVDGDVETVTDDYWLPVGTITALCERSKITLYNVEGAEDGQFVIDIPHVLKSLDYVDEYYLTGYGSVIPLYVISPENEEYGVVPTVFNVSYRVNPSYADLDGYEYSMIARKIRTRVSGDDTELISKVDTEYDGVDEIKVKGYFDYEKLMGEYINNNDRPARSSNYSNEYFMPYLYLKATKDGQDVVSTRPLLVMPSFVYSIWAVGTNDEWYPATTAVTEEAMEDDAVKVGEVYNVGEKMHLFSYVDGPFNRDVDSLESLGFDVKYNFSILKDYGAWDKVLISNNGVLKVKDEKAVGQYVIVVADAVINNPVDANGSVTYTAYYKLRIDPRSTEDVTVDIDLGKFDYDKIDATILGVAVPFDKVLETLVMEVDGFHHIYSDALNTNPAEINKGVNYVDARILPIEGVSADEYIGGVYFTPKVKTGKNTLTVLYSPSVETYPKVYVNLNYEIEFNAIPPVLNPDYVTYNGTDSVITVKGKKVGSVWRNMSSVREHILDYGQYLAPTYPNIERLYMVKVGGDPDFEIYSTSIVHDYTNQEIEYIGTFDIGEEYVEVGVDIYVRLVNGENFKVKNYVVRFTNPFELVVNDVVLENHRIDACIAQGGFKVVDRQDGSLIFDSATGSTTDYCNIQYPGLINATEVGITYVNNADDTFGNNLKLENATGVFTWENNGGSLQVDKTTTYSVIFKCGLGEYKSNGNVTVKKDSNSKPAHE